MAFACHQDARGRICVTSLMNDPLLFLYRSLAFSSAANLSVVATKPLNFTEAKSLRPCSKISAPSSKAITHESFGHSFQHCFLRVFLQSNFGQQSSMTSCKEGEGVGCSFWDEIKRQRVMEKEASPENPSNLCDIILKSSRYCFMALPEENCIILS